MQCLHTTHSLIARPRLDGDGLPARRAFDELAVTMRRFASESVIGVCRVCSKAQCEVTELG